MAERPHGATERRDGNGHSAAQARAHDRTAIVAHDVLVLAALPIRLAAVVANDPLSVPASLAHRSRAAVAVERLHTAKTIILVAALAFDGTL
eukprot:3866725-Prymnesium_polylepis.2